jgi:hypothetical protein
MSIEIAPLEPFLGKNISEICLFSIGKDDSKNHCAHFVSHVMGYEFAETCKNFTFEDKQGSGKGATLRVEKIFNSCVERGPWAERPAHLRSCLVFVTVSSNIVPLGNQVEMRNNPQKHVGILANGRVWNYSNSQKKVVADPESIFLDRFKRVYHTSGQVVQFFYGSFLR